MIFWTEFKWINCHYCVQMSIFPFETHSVFIPFLPIQHMLVDDLFSKYSYENINFTYVCAKLFYSLYIRPYRVMNLSVIIVLYMQDRKRLWNITDFKSVGERVLTRPITVREYYWTRFLCCYKSHDFPMWHFHIHGVRYFYMSHGALYVHLASI